MEIFLTYINLEAQMLKPKAAMPPPQRPTNNTSPSVEVPGQSASPHPEETHATESSRQS